MEKKSDEEIIAERELQLRISIFTEIMKEVPERYRDVSFKSMPHHPKVKLDAQRWNDVVANLDKRTRENPERGIVFYGPPSVGKTTLMAAVFRRLANLETARRAAGSGKYILHWLDVGAWAEQAIDYKFGKCRKPRLTAEDLLRSQVRVALFLDEFDKVGDQQNKRDILDAFVRAAYDKRALIFAATNMTREEFESMQDGHLTRRIKEDGDNLNVNLFEGESK